MSPGEVFLPNWHLEALCYHLELVRAGKIRRLKIEVPPRSLKSVCTSVALPAFILGHDPTAKIITVSYSSDLAAKHAADCRAVMQSAWYSISLEGRDGDYEIVVTVPDDCAVTLEVEAGFAEEARGRGAATLLLNLEQSQLSEDFLAVRLGPASQIVPAWVSEIIGTAANALRSDRH